MSYIEISFIPSEKDPYSEIIVAKLHEIEFESYMETEKGVKAYIQERLLNRESLEKVIKELKSLFSLDFQIKAIKRNNWNKYWEKNFSPVEINHHCIVRSDFHKSFTDYKYEIIIVPKMSFGTGHHETTFLMMNEMFKLDFTNKSVLDIGCGTGILSILAEMLGSSRTLGIDIDKWSYKNSLDNARLNKFNSIEFKLTEITTISEGFDILLANINYNVILSNLAKYVECMNEKSSCLLSGFFSSNIKRIIDHAENLGLMLVSHKNKNKWHLLHFVK